MRRKNKIYISRISKLRLLASIAKYRKLNRPLWQNLVADARVLRGLPIIHVNSAGRGGGVAELLRSQIPLEQALGLDSRWYVLSAPKEFFKITKKLHNLLQGAPGKLTNLEKAVYTNVGRKLREEFIPIIKSVKQGVVIIHDPQPAALLSVIPPHLNSVWRLHIDLSHANPWSTRVLHDYAEQAECVVVSNKAFTRAFRGREIIIEPAIDPFSEKNKPLPLSRARAIMRKFGIHDDWPILSQVSRFDIWKDPVGVVRAYYEAKKSEPHLQLLLAGFMTAEDDPEALQMLAKVVRYARGDNSIFLFSNLADLKGLSNDMFVNAVHTASTIVVQKSIREGFGLTITEGMWKQNAVIAAPSAGAKAQIINGKNGFIELNARSMARKIMLLLNNESLRKRLGKQAYKSVERHFLFPRYLSDCLRLYKKLQSKP